MEEKSKMTDLMSEYFSILIQSIYERIYGDESKEDLLLEKLDELHRKLTEEECNFITEIFKELKG
jgi:hypothetical protein